MLEGLGVSAQELVEYQAGRGGGISGREFLAMAVKAGKVCDLTYIPYWEYLIEGSDEVGCICECHRCRTAPRRHRLTITQSR